MKISEVSLGSSIFHAVAITGCGSASAAEIPFNIAGLTTAELTTPENWVGGVVPGPADTAAWRTDVDLDTPGAQESRGGTLTLSSPVSWLGLRHEDSGDALTLTGSDITLGTSGITEVSFEPLTLNNNIVLGADQTWTNTATTTVNGIISGSFALTKSGAGILQLNAANAYTGSTIVTAGTLGLADAFLADTADVLVFTGAALDLLTGTTDIIDELIVDGRPVVPGVYGAIGSGARFQRPFIANGSTGTLTVTTGPAADDYPSWETGNGITGAGSGTDSDFDGIPNGIEFVVGGDPSGSNSNDLLPTLTVDGTFLNFEFRRTDGSATYDPYVEYGSTLAGWTEAEAGVNGVIIDEEDDFYGLNTDQVIVRIPRAMPIGPKLFARLRVDIP